ncbi:hypothetical protein TraAM80_06482 [Trypanosoma rangeli]|uniref:Uncharacterized protein n=1 Tax=Trypanosoma rangeli TaxID=5698 RepID=A0A3R7LS50_TRYRA|nr:uncharacterized protein TraAM80_06482 [Trypanosoma rangeli]RNF02296.1 hypothetical protein TraAM80_06482 [Trypanosoma rangeli]|eukprot:RNF02296.1 hypothetical protein TraAM80_06482 [Trypanosoma rangeli]
MAHLRSLSASHEDEDKNSFSGSGNESEDSSSSCSASVSSSGSSLSPSSHPRASPEKGSCDALAMKRMERHQRLRRLLSQRNVGDTNPVDDGKYVEPFTTRKGVLDADDSVILSTFSNSLLFSRLLAVLGSCDNSARLENFDEALSAANPTFYRSFKLPLEEAAAQTMRGSALTHRECAALERGSIVVRRRKCDRPACTAAFGASAEAVKRGRTADDPSVTRGNTATSGIIAKSLRSWEQHLSEELRAEGVSIETFRQQRHGNSYVEEMRFLQESQWADYQRELRLEEKRKEQEAKRAIRRGESNIN